MQSRIYKISIHHDQTLLHISPAGDPSDRPAIARDCSARMKTLYLATIREGLQVSERKIVAVSNVLARIVV